MPMPPKSKISDAGTATITERRTGSPAFRNRGYLKGLATLHAKTPMFHQNNLVVSLW